MSNLKKLQKKLLKELLSQLEPLGFERKIHGQSFWLPIEKGRASIHLSFIEHEFDFDVTVDVAIRFDLLEELKNSCREDLTLKERNETYSIGIEYGNLIGNGQHRWSVKGEDEIEDIILDIFQVIKTELLPYIEKYSDPYNVLDVMLDEDESSLHALRYIAAINAVGLSIILNKTDGLENLILEKTEFLTRTKNFGLPFFLEFIDCIKSKQTHFE